MGSGEKRSIPRTKTEWDRLLPDDYDNSLVDRWGNNYDNGWNFDESDEAEESDDEDSGKESRNY